MNSDNRLLKLMFALGTALIMGVGLAGCSEEGAAPGAPPGTPEQQEPGAAPGPGGAGDGESEGGGF